jgi:hypothetical protein
MRTFVILIALASAAHAERPADVLAVVDAAAPKSELAAWQKTIAQLAPGATVPTLDTLPGVVGGLLGAKQLDGIDWTKPIHVVIMNPNKLSPPLVLVAPVKTLPALKASAKAANLFVAVEKGWATIGPEPGARAVGAFARAVAQEKPAHGVHARAFADAIWGAFGAQILVGGAALKAQLAQPQPNGEPPAVSPKTMGGLVDALVAGLQQSERLGVDVETRDSGEVELVLSLDARPDTSVDGFFRVQKPSDFSLAQKLSASPTTMILAGRIDLSGIQAAALEWMLAGAQVDAKARAGVEELYKLMTGEMAMVGTIPSLDKMQMQYLLGVSDTKRALELYAQAVDLFTRNTVLDSPMKMSQKKLPVRTYDGLRIDSNEIHYDASAMKLASMPKQWDTRSAWTAFDGLVAFAMGGNAPGAVEKLVDSARHAKEPLSLDAATARSLARARDDKASLWMRMDMSTMGQAMTLPAPTAAALSPSMELGFEGHRAHLLVRFNDKP